MKYEEITEISFEDLMQEDKEALAMYIYKINKTYNTLIRKINELEKKG